MENKELRRLVSGLLTQMPEEWRRALLLHDIRGLMKREVAEGLGKPEEEVGGIRERARQYLRQKLTEYGYDFKRAA